MKLQMKKTQSLPSGNIYSSGGNRRASTQSAILQAAHEWIPDVGVNRELWLQAESLFLGRLGETVRQEMTSSRDLGRRYRKDSPESRNICVKETIRQDLDVECCTGIQLGGLSLSYTSVALGALFPTTLDLGFLICKLRVWLGHL